MSRALCVVLSLVMPGCATIHERAHPTTTTQREPLPPVRLRHVAPKVMVEVVDEGALRMVGAATCESGDRVTYVTKTHYERTAHGIWRDVLPLAVGVVAAIVIAETRPSERRAADRYPEDEPGGSVLSPEAAIALMGGMVTGVALGVDAARQVDRTDYSAQTTVEKREERCAVELVAMTPVTLLLDDGTRVPATTDANGKLRPQPDVATRVRAVLVGEQEVTVTRTAGGAPR